MHRRTCKLMKGEKSDSFLKKPLHTAKLPSDDSSLSTTPSFRLTLKTLSLASSDGEEVSNRAVSLPYRASLHAAPVDTSSKRDMMTNESCKEGAAFTTASWASPTAEIYDGLVKCHDDWRLVCSELH